MKPIHTNSIVIASDVFVMSFHGVDIYRTEDRGPLTHYIVVWGPGGSECADIEPFYTEYNPSLPNEVFELIQAHKNLMS